MLVKIQIKSNYRSYHKPFNTFKLIYGKLVNNSVERENKYKTYTGKALFLNNH